MNIDKAEQFIFDKLVRELPVTLHYHSVGHIKDVLNAVEHIASSEGISGNDLIMLRTAAMFHDSGFILQSKEHEQLGCDLARVELPKFDYDKEQVEKICGMIMATKIPQAPRNLLEEIICDADLDYLGRDDYWKISGNLFKEINESSSLKEIDWLNIQIKFLEEHHYFTKTAIQERKEQKEVYLAEIQQLLKNKTV